MRWFSTRSEIAEYLGISRMTLSRWEKIIPIFDRWPHTRIIRVDRDEVKKWFYKLREKHRLRSGYRIGCKLEIS